MPQRNSETAAILWPGEDRDALPELFARLLQRLRPNFPAIYSDNGWVSRNF
jgi:hypothetical protein